MEIIEINENYNVEIFNSVAQHPLQSWEWGEVRKKAGIKVVRIGQFQDNNLVEVYTMTVHKLPLVPYFIGYIPRSVSPSEGLITFLFDYGKRQNLIFIKLEPYIQKNVTSYTFQDSRLLPSPHPLFPQWTQILDLTKTEDVLLSNLKPKTRYNIKLAQKKGVEIKEVTGDHAFEIFSKLYFQTTKRQKYQGHNVQYHKFIWDSLKSKIAHILVAFYKNEPLSVYELFHFKDTLYYPYGGSSVDHRDVMASNLLMWEAILFGKKLGASKFDLWGSLPPDYDRGATWAGFTRFKEGYGTKFMGLADSYDLVIDRNIYRIYNLFHKLRERFI